MMKNLNFDDMRHQELQYHTKSVVSLKFSHSGNFIASASADKKAQIYDSNSGLLKAVLDEEHAMGLNDCAWLSEDLLCTGSDDGTAKIWDLEAAVAVQTFKTNKTLVYSLCADPYTGLLLAGSLDGRIWLFHPSTKGPITTFAAHADPVVSLQISPTLSTATAAAAVTVAGGGGGGPELLSGGQEGLVRIWDLRRMPAPLVPGATAAMAIKSSLSDGLCLKTLLVQDEGSNIPLSCASYTPNGNCVLASSLDSTHKIIPLDMPAANHNSSTSASHFDGPIGDHSSSSSSSSHSSSNSSSVSVSSGNCANDDVNSGDIKRLRITNSEVNGHHNFLSNNNHNYYKNSGTSGDKYGNSRSTVQSWKRREVVMPVFQFQGHVNKKYPTQSILYSCALDGAGVVSGSEDGKLCCWNLNNQELSYAIPAHEGPLLALACHPHSETLHFATGGFDGSVKLWRREERSIPDPPPAAPTTTTTDNVNEDNDHEDNDDNDRLGNNVSNSYSGTSFDQSNAQ